MKIGLFFGTFNPIHRAHMMIALDSLRRFSLEKLLFIPSPQNPLKKIEEILPFEDRVLFLEKALEEEFLSPSERKKIDICLIEEKMPKPSYSYKTLQELRKIYPKDVFFLILGEDNLDSFPYWKNLDSILKEVTVILYPRKRENKWIQKPDHFIFVEDFNLDTTSSTDVREKILKGENIESLIPWKSVRNLIKEKLFFKS